MAKLPTHKAKSGDSSTLGNHRFEIVVPTCKICKLDADIRQRIDMMLATGWSQTHVRHFWNDLLEDTYGPEYLNGMNISRHANNHVSVREAAIRKIIEERARQLGLEVDSTVGLMLTKEAVLEAIVQNGLENLIRGYTMAEPKEMIVALQTLKDFEAESSEVGIDELWKQYHAFAEAVKAIVPVDMFDRVVERFDLIMGRTPAVVTANLQAPKEIGHALIEEEVEDAVFQEVVEVAEPQIEPDGHEHIASWIPVDEQVGE